MEEILLKEIISLLGTIRTAVIVIEVIACLVLGMLIARAISGK